MPYWLYEHVIKDNDERAPQWALQSTLNWIKALSYEVTLEHGSTPIEQWNSCRNVIKDKNKAKSVTVSMAQIFEPLFHSLTFCNALISINRTCNHPAGKLEPTRSHFVTRFSHTPTKAFARHSVRSRFAP